ncbi:BAR domain-like protein A BdpA [Alishewanella sp. d11]|uniref:BAR domain-like protein A BdpA n=1 Tax=Alishewanella sp. d11 TaxID=3414030 RepID=UPI003BF7E26C
MRHIAILCGFMLAAPVFAKPVSTVFSSDFEQGGLTQWRQLGDCQLTSELVRSGEGALRCAQGNSSLFSRAALTEQGLLELWVLPESEQTSYRIQVLVSDSNALDSTWQPVALIEQPLGSSGYKAHRISIDDPGRKFLRLDIEALHGFVQIDDLHIERILLGTALHKNEQRIISGILDKLRRDQNIALQAESFRTLGTNYAAQLEIQRQYLDYANALHSGISLVLASSERNKMSNPMAYASFRNIISDTKRVSSKLQQARLNSMIKPFGDLVTATLNVVSAGTYAAFAEPFKSFLAMSFDRSSYQNAGLSRADRKFAEANGLKIYQDAERFLNELERELQQVSQLESDLAQILLTIDSYRRELEKHLRDSLLHANIAGSKENISRVLSKDENVRQQLIEAVAGNISLKAGSYLNDGNNTELIRFVLKTSELLDAMQSYKDGFNQITSAMLTYYERFERSIAAEQNPFTEKADREAWENHARKAREYLQQSKASFTKAYL